MKRNRCTVPFFVQKGEHYEKLDGNILTEKKPLFLYFKKQHPKKEGGGDSPQMPMMARTHLQVALFTGLGTCILTDASVYEGIALISSSLLGGLVVDIDEPKSKIGRIAKPISIPLRIFNLICKVLNFLTLKKSKIINGMYENTKHHGIIHSIFMAFITFIPCILLINYYKTAAALFGGTALGITSHLISDYISGHKTLMPFLPFSQKRVGINLIPTNSLRERLFRFIITGLNLYIIVNILITAMPV